MRRVLPMPALLAVGLAVLAPSACTSGETQVDVGGEPTAPTGATPAEPTGPTAPTAAGAFTGPVSIDVSAAEASGLQAELYSCDGAEGTWTYTLRGGAVGFDIDETFDMAGGDGTLVISDAFEVAGLGTLSFTDTIELVISGTPEAPTMEATKITVEVEGGLPGVDETLLEGLFAQNEPLPILVGAARC